MRPCTTALGIEALRAALLGEELRFTKVIIGAGYLPETIDKSSVTDVIEKIETRPIISYSRGKNEGTVTTTFTLTNAGRNEGYYFREIGVYAATESTGEILFTYVNSGDQAEYIPAYGVKNVEKTIPITNAVCNTELINIFVDSMLTATIEQVNEAIDTAQNALDVANQVNEREVKCPDGGCPALMELKAQIERLERGMYDNVDSNAFNIDFKTLEGKTITAGVWNQTAGRLEC